MRSAPITEEESNALTSSSLFYEAVVEINSLLRPKYEEILWSTGPSKLALVCSGIVSASLRQAGAIDAVFQADFPNEADPLLRITTENLSNLLYILYAGPAIENRSRDELAAQYFAFGETQHGKLVTKAREWSRTRVAENGQMAGQAMSLQSLEAHEKSVEQKVAAAKTAFPNLGSSRWHQLNAEDMVAKVIEYLPAYARSDETLWKSAHMSITTWNFAIHSSSFMFNRDVSKAERGELFGSPDSLPISAGLLAAKQALLAWQAVADVFGAEALVIGAKFTEIVNSKGNGLVKALRSTSSLAKV